MNDDRSPQITAGALYRVTAVEVSSRTLFAENANGTAVTIRGLEGDLPEKGDIIFLNSESWERAPRDTWPSENLIGIVLGVLNDGRIVVDTNFNLKFFEKPAKMQVSVGNTVEYNSIDGILKVLDEKPLERRSLDRLNYETADQYLYENSGENLTFDDFGGYPEAVSRAQELIQNQIEKRQYLDAMKVRPIRGILFSGPPGTGKTFLARIIAQKSKAKFYLVNGPTIVSKWLGETESTLRKIFEAAKESKSGAIIFFDEIDSIAEKRSDSSHEASKKLVAQLLTLMDGFDENEGNVVVIAATNRPDSLDPAIRRPGRFDWEIEFGHPTDFDRSEILRKSISRHPISSDLPVADIVKLTKGWSAADLVLIIAEAGQVAANDKREKISAEDFAQGYERVAAKFRNRLEGASR